VKRIGIVGATGYTGVELLRLLVNHPEVEISFVTSRSNVGVRVDTMFPNLRGFIDIEFSDPSSDALAECDLVFFATPNGIAMKHVPALLKGGTKVIDLAADFRIKDLSVWSQYYDMEHACPDLVAEAVYGLPEINREKIKSTNLVANPGCYPTAVTLGLLPLVESGLINLNGIIADTKSGISGAGRGANVATLLSEAGESFKAYGVGTHRHQPEIAQTLSLVADNSSIDLTFVPHLLPIIRGIHATLYADEIARNATDLQVLFETRYKNEPFVTIIDNSVEYLDEGFLDAQLCNNTNRIELSLYENKDYMVVISRLDNLGKGASGAAVQNMNIMLGLDENLGLKH